MSRDLALLKGALFDMPEEQRKKITELKAQFEKIVTESGDEGLIALAWLALEIDAKS